MKGTLKHIVKALFIAYYFYFFRYPEIVQVASWN